MRDHICPPEHKHARTPTCYRAHGCGCADCRAANTARCYERKKLIAYGRWQPTLVDSTPAHEHLIRLTKMGMSTVGIANASRVDANAIRAILRGNKDTGRIPERIFHKTATRILAVPADLSSLPDDMRVNARGTRRRLQALATRGWCMRELARRAGINPSRLERAMQCDRVMVSTHRAISALYDQLWDQDAPAQTRDQRKARTRALTTATERGWAPPLAWDDIDTDDAAAQLDTRTDDGYIDEIAVELVLSGGRAKLTLAERIETTRRGTQRGLSLSDLAELLDVDVRTIERYRGSLRAEKEAA